MSNFKERWNIKSNWQFFVIILVFAITGSSSAMISKPFLGLIGIDKQTTSFWIYYSLYVLLIFPFYQVLLVFFGFLFGQLNFFWSFEKKILRALKLESIINLFENKKRNN